MKFESVPFLKLTPVRPEVETAIDDVLTKGVLMNGPYLEGFKKEFGKYLKVEHVIPTANCTDALEIILRSIGVRKDDEVVTTSFSWFSDASVIKIVGAKVVFCDVDLKHYGMQLSDLEKKISRKTKAVIVPHLFGMVHPDIEKIVSICSENDVVLIEDCAQAHGASLNGKMAGAFGDVAAFSFYPTKNLGALGDAGAIICKEESLAKECQLWVNHGQLGRNEHVQLGRNSRMDELQAAVLTANLPFLDSDNEKRRQLAAIYFEILKDAASILPANVEGHVYHQFVIKSDNRRELQEFLIANGIETDIHYPKALSDMMLFQAGEKCSNATLSSKTVLSLPIHPNHSKEEIEFVAGKILAFLRL